jgi:uncharacterized membrane protein
VIFVKGSVSLLLALVSLVGAVVFYWLYARTSPPQTIYIVLVIIFAVLLVVFGGMFLSGRVNKTEDIHITE